MAYVSNASNIVAHDGEVGRSIYLWDRTTKTSQMISGIFDGFEFRDDSASPQVSSDGRFVTYSSDTQGLVEGQRFRDSEVFLWERASGMTIKVSNGVEGSDPNASSVARSVSADGNHVLFASRASNLVTGDGGTDRKDNLYLWSRLSGTTVKVTNAYDGGKADADSGAAEVSDDGQRVMFSSEADNLVAHDGNGVSDVFVWDASTRAVERVARPDARPDSSYAASRLAGTSRDGRFVSYVSQRVDPGASPQDVKADLFVLDTTDGSTTRVTESTSISADDLWASPYSSGSVSDDGRRVTFESRSSAIASGDVNTSSDSFVWDRQTRSFDLVARNDAGTSLDEGSDFAKLSSDGRFVVYTSDSTDAQDPPPYRNGRENVYWLDRQLAAEK